MIEGHEIKKIYDEYKQVVFKVAYKYSRNSEVANDIAHNVFVLFMQDAKQRKSIEEYTNIKAWLTVTTRNTAYNYLVKMKHEIYISEESEKTLEMYIDEKVQEASAESRCLNELRHKKYKSVHDNVLAGVLKKNERWYQAIMLTYDTEITQIEAAEIMGMSTQAFYTMLHRAKVWIRKKYGIEYEELDEI